MDRVEKEVNPIHGLCGYGAEDTTSSLPHQDSNLEWRYQKP